MANLAHSGPMIGKHMAGEDPVTAFYAHTRGRQPPLTSTLVPGKHGVLTQGNMHRGRVHLPTFQSRPSNGLAGMRALMPPTLP